MRMMLNRRDNGEDGKKENTQGRPDSSYSLQELLIFPQFMMMHWIMATNPCLPTISSAGR